MELPTRPPLVSTITKKCRACYSCVRECPAKAIRITSGKPEVIPERCIGCGHCVRVCSQHAKQVFNSMEKVYRLLESGVKIAACLDSSFPAEFITLDVLRLVGMIRDLGFHLVTDASFGADLVAERYRSLLARDPHQRYIATTCPAVVDFVTRYHPTLIPCLAPILSPMAAQARVLRRWHGEELRFVFIGPCIARKYEMAGEEIDAVLTFQELRQMMREEKIFPGSIEPSDFDPPYGGAGSLFPISRGFLQAAGIQEDLLTGDVVATEGKSNFVEALREFETGDLDARFLEIRSCDGCLHGPGISNSLPLFSRRSMISRYSRERITRLDDPRWREDLAAFSDADLHRTFTSNYQPNSLPSMDELSMILGQMGKFSPEDELNCGACGYGTCREHARAVFRGLADSEMCLPFTIAQFRKTMKELAASNEQIASIQEALVRSEKLASMGQLAAGIAHEINNPLGVVLMYAHLVLNGCDRDSPLREDLKMIVEQAERCKKIVGSLLNFSRQNRVVYHPVDIRQLIDKSLKSFPIPPAIAVHVEHDGQDPLAELDVNQMTQVLVNLIDNACAAMAQGGHLTIQTRSTQEVVQILVTDTGIGIPRENLPKIFEPFFTTKQIGKGTGLGLAVTYGILKMHRGDIQVESNADPGAGPTGSTFTVTLPRKGITD